MKDSITLGIDIGGTKISLSVYQFKNQENPKKLTNQRIPTESSGGYEGFLSRLKTQISALFEDFSIEAVGIGLPGVVDPQTNLLLMGNTQEFVGKPLLQDLQIEFPKTAFAVDNDASCFALAEHLFGAGTKLKNPKIGLGIILGTGVGGGIIFNDEIMHGRYGSNGEFGHMQIKDEDIECYCGQKGCAELYLSGTGIERQYLSLTQKNLSSPKIFEAAQTGNKDCEKILKNYRRDMLSFLRSLSNALMPDYFVFGGGLSSQKIIYENLEEELKPLLFASETAPRIFQNELGDDSGTLGAAYLAYQKLLMT